MAEKIPVPYIDSKGLYHCPCGAPAVAVSPIGVAVVKCPVCGNVYRLRGAKNEKMVAAIKRRAAKEKAKGKK